MAALDSVWIALGGDRFEWYFPARLPTCRRALDLVRAPKTWETIFRGRRAGFARLLCLYYPLVGAELSDFWTIHFRPGQFRRRTAAGKRQRRVRNHYGLSRSSG